MMKVNACYFVFLLVLKLTAVDATRERRSDDVSAVETQVSDLAQEVTLLKAQLTATNNKLQSVIQSQGSTFVRWGRTKCPPTSEIVYSGRAGGSYRENTGRSPNRLCLPMNPQYDDVNTPPYYGRLYGAEYLQISTHHTGLVPCSVCHVPRNAVLMVPATLTCPQGWEAEYTGHLASEDHNHASIAEYVCLDGSPENAVGSAGKSGAASYFYFTLSVCGTLPCPPYVNNKVVTCVVCSK